VRSSIRVRSWGLVIAVPILLALQAFAPTPVVMMCLLVAAGLLATSFIWVLGLRGGISSKRERKRDWAQMGETLEEEFAISNKSWLPVPWAEINDANDLPGYDTRCVVGVPAQGETHWTTHSPCMRRGVYTLGPTHIRSGDPFGLFQVTLEQPDVQPFYVYPALTMVPLLARPHARLYGSARSNRRSFTATTNITGIRSYTPGDPFNHIHWRSTAHRSIPGQDEIMVKEFEPEPLADFWIVLDLDSSAHLGEGDASTEEYAVGLAASLGYQMLHSWSAVGLIAQGAEPVILQPQRGPGQLSQLLRALAGVHADGRTPLAQVLEQQASLFRSGAYCALLTPSSDPAWALALPHLLDRAVHVTAFLLDGQPFGGTCDIPGAAERLANLGVTSRIVGPDLYAQLNALQSHSESARDRELGAKPGPERATSLGWTSAMGGQAT